MKKRFITLLLAIVMIASFMVVFTACSKTETINSESAQTVVGSYSLFRTTKVQEYLSFLENFDETKYEIVDISTSMSRGYSSEFYMVT